MAAARSTGGAVETAQDAGATAGRAVSGTGGSDADADAKADVNVRVAVDVDMDGNGAVPQNTAGTEPAEPADNEAVGTKAVGTKAVGTKAVGTKAAYNEAVEPLRREFVRRLCPPFFCRGSHIVCIMA